LVSTTFINHGNEFPVAGVEVLGALAGGLEAEELDKGVVGTAVAELLRSDLLGDLDLLPVLLDRGPG